MSSTGYVATTGCSANLGATGLGTQSALAGAPEQDLSSKFQVGADEADGRRKVARVHALQVGAVDVPLDGPRSGLWQDTGSGVRSSWSQSVFASELCPLLLTSSVISDHIDVFRSAPSRPPRCMLRRVLSRRSLPHRPTCSPSQPRHSTTCRAAPRLPPRRPVLCRPPLCRLLRLHRRPHRCRRRPRPSRHLHRYRRARPCAR